MRCVRESACNRTHHQVSSNIRSEVMATRQAHARRRGTLEDGKGTVDFGDGLFEAPYSFASRFEAGTGTNPEELSGAAHASCFAMSLSLSLLLSEANFNRTISMRRPA